MGMGAKGTDAGYLRTEQYRDASNLSARVNLHRCFSTNPCGWFHWIFDRLRSVASEDARRLDVGCGTPALWSENRDRLPPRWRVVLSDFSPGMLDTACERIGNLDQVAGACLANAQALPFPDGAFEVVVANHMLYHVPDLSRAVAELRRVVCSGGHLLASTNGRGHLQELDDLVGSAGGVTDGEALAARFGLETGERALVPPFSRCALSRFADGLVVTEVESLVAYLRSSAADLPPATIARARHVVAAAIDR